MLNRKMVRRLFTGMGLTFDWLLVLFLFAAAPVSPDDDYTTKFGLDRLVARHPKLEAGLADRVKTELASERKVASLPGALHVGDSCAVPVQNRRAGRLSSAIPVLIIENNEFS